MGAPKQKWTPEEEAALKAGVVKHGAGKWRTILKDPEFSSILYLRSNVDLKDKWRNMSVMANGWGSRDKARLALKRLHSASKQDENSMMLSVECQNNEDILDTEALAISKEYPQISGPKRSFVRLDNRIMKAISSLKEQGGSNKTTIASFIEEQYWSPPNFKRLLSAKLKYLTANGKLIKMKRKYRIAPSIDSRRRSSPPPSPPMVVHEGCSKDEIILPDLTRDQVDIELAKMRKMTPQEAATAAALAVAEAEAAIAEAEEAAREAEEAEADAEAAQSFAKAAMKTLKGRNICPTKMMIPA